MHRIGPRRARAGWASALALASAFATTAPHAATQAATPPAALPRPPHQVTPDAPLFPDYYALALTHTSIQDDPTWRALHLQAPPGHATPAFIVQPVQTQAYGFSPTFRALLGARLDQELQRRHVDATRQTDIVDWRGPFVRRSDDATVAAFAAEHASSALLALYLGHDADGHAFVTLGRTERGKTRLAHRRVDIPQGRIATLDAFTAVLPPLLAEVGLGDARPAASLPTGQSIGCAASMWNLDDVPVSAAPVDTACHALLMGTLMPDFLSSVAELTQPSAPDRLAWLARAWVEADALATRLPAMRSAATLASLQLRLDDKLEDSASLVGDHDPVVQPLARMLWGSVHAARTPPRSRNDAVNDYTREAIFGLPPFARAVMVERAGFAAPFRRVDICTMQLALQHVKKPAECDDDGSIFEARSTHVASRGQLQLVEEWRVGAAWTALHVEGRQRGSAQGVAEALHDMPPRIAAHPFVRTMHYAVSESETPALGAKPHLEQARTRLLDYAQAIATLQRDDVLIRHNNPVVPPELDLDRKDPTQAQVRDDLERLASVADLDFYAAMLWRPERPAGLPAGFMADGNFAQANSMRPSGGGPPAVGHASWATSPSSFARSPVPVALPYPERALPPRDTLVQALASNPSDMSTRITLALVGLEHGASVADTRRLIDARPVREDAIGEGNDWAEAAHMFYFAGELESARFYYAKASRSRTASEADLMARVRIAAIEGNVREAFERTRQRAQRYGSEWAISDEAGYLFMLRQPAEAWPQIVPRMQTSTGSQLWRSALAGHRIAGVKLDQLPAWLQQNQLERVSISNRPQGPSWLLNYAIFDRFPTSSDVAWLKDKVLTDGIPMRVGGATVMKAAIDAGTATNPAALASDIRNTAGDERTLLWPFYGWALWNASGGKDSALDDIRAAPLEGGFEAVLSKAMVLAADGRRDEALRFLSAARWELGRNGSDHEIRDQLRMAPYDFVLATWLMTRKTGEPAYAQQGLAIATAYQHVVEYMGWPYAAEALLGRDPKAREIAACRAQFLDSASMFLHESGLHPDPKSAACVKATAW